MIRIELIKKDGVVGIMALVQAGELVHAQY